LFAEHFEGDIITSEGKPWGEGVPLLEQEGWLRIKKKTASEAAQTGWSVVRHFPD
jgi:hypothetical protein